MFRLRLSLCATTLLLSFSYCCPALQLPATMPTPVYFERTGWFLCADQSKAGVLSRSWFDVARCFWFVQLRAGQVDQVAFSLGKKDHYLSVKKGRLALTAVPYWWQLQYRAPLHGSTPFTLHDSAGYLATSAVPASFSFAPTTQAQMQTVLLQNNAEPTATLLVHFGTPPVR